ncbi:phospholipase A2 inhibitor and Ly6/PLAUR domain-containing protein-like [Thunnus thynnus]|uniref:phospholipase A2 inhibitor and Ly6/PLAUR domain-containing protein-like n=1 Tax=Thunnus thynnus TaxID=8237 RepID=UPI003527F55F
MMKLILSLTLIWTLSSTAEALECWTGQGTDIKQQTLHSCNSTQLCATIATQENDNGTFTQNTIRSCVSSSIFSEGKHTYSYSFGLATTIDSVHVCSTDGCNSEIIPYPDVPKKNNLQCFTCDDKSPAVCNKTLRETFCVGVQDRCISRTVTEKDGKTAHTFGCASANFCELASLMKLQPDSPSKFLSEPKCCGSSFCNSAWSVKLNVIPLLFGLITLIVC